MLAHQHEEHNSTPHVGRIEMQHLMISAKQVSAMKEVFGALGLEEHESKEAYVRERLEDAGTCQR